MSSIEIPNLNAQTADFEFAALHEAYYYPRAIIEEFAPYLGQHVLEVGAGIGQLTALLADQVGPEKLLGIEPDKDFALLFKERCPNIRLLEGTISALPKDTPCDTIVSVNVIEHIRDHVEELARYRERLSSSGGYICILTPAHPELYAKIDEDFGHFRRYTKSSMREALVTAGFEPKVIQYFNFPGYFVWLLNFKLLQRRTFNPLMVRIYDRMIFRLSHLIEQNLLRPPLGQSVLAIAKA